MAALMPEGKQRYTNSAGLPLVGGKLYTYAAGTSTPKATYADADATVPNTNPIILDDRGEATVFWDGVYKVALYDASDNLIWTQDNLDDPSRQVLDLQAALDAALAGLPKVVNSIAELRSLDKTVYAKAQVLGYYAPSDGGGGVFQYDSTDTTSVDNGGTFIVATDGGRWKLVLVGDVTGKQFGMKFDGVTDDGPAMANAVAYCLSTKRKLVLNAGDAVIDGEEFVLNSPITIEGAGRNSTRLIFKDVPTKTVRTYAAWRAEYDVANYSVSSDAAIACGFVISSANVFLRDFRMSAYWDPTVNYPLPFNSATDYPTSNYDNGILIQRSDVSLERLLVDGPWGEVGNNGGVKLDITQPGGAVEHVKINDCEVHGRWGLVIEGPHGSGVGPNFAALSSSDSRGGGGVSDLLCIGSQFYDTQLRLMINGVTNKLVRKFSTTAGALYIDGQAAFNSAKRQQHIRFEGCRFANTDYYTFFINFCNRVEFDKCHTEYRSGAYLTDGVTVISASDTVGRYSTVNSRNIVFTAGEKSGEPNNMVYKDTTNNVAIVTEDMMDDPAPAGSRTPGRMLGGFQLRDVGLWTPTLAGATTAGAPTGTFFGVYARVGNLVIVWANIALTSKGGMVGAISVGGLPFTCSNIWSGTYDPDVAVSTQLVTTGDAGMRGQLDNNTKTMRLFKIRSGLSYQSVVDADFVDTSVLNFTAMYLTEDA
jgi:hypothetical protein